MYILGEQLYFWDLKKLILDLRAKPLTDRAQLYYLCLIIFFISPLVSLVSNLDELWGIEWYCALSWVAKFCAILGLVACCWSSKIRKKYTHHSSRRVYPELDEGREVAGTPNSFLSCLISLSWVIGFRILIILFTGFWLLVLLDNFNLQWFNPDYLLWYLNLWVT